MPDKTLKEIFANYRKALEDGATSSRDIEGDSKMFQVDTLEHFLTDIKRIADAADKLSPKPIDHNEP